MSASTFANIRSSHLITDAAQSSVAHLGSNIPSTSPLKMDDLDWDKDDEDSFEVPDFHFDWGVVKEKTGSKMSEEALQPNSVHPLRNLRPGMTTRTHTPPSHSRTSIGSSAQSSRISSSHSSSSLSRTSPEVGDMNAPREPLARLRSTSSTDGSGGEPSTGSSSRMYGGRAFSRVVSAPLQHSYSKPADDHRAQGTFARHSPTEGAFSMSSDTATIRPTREHSDAQLQGIPETYATPAVGIRVLSRGTSSTARRVAGLSRFGGPARRVPLAQEAETLDEAEAPGHVLIGSPRRHADEAVSPDRDNRSVPQPERQQYRYRASPPPPEQTFVPTIEEEAPEVSRAHREVASSSRHAQALLKGVPTRILEEEEQENRYDFGDQGKLGNHKTQDRERHLPLQPAHSVPAISESMAPRRRTHVAQTANDELRPAPPPPVSGNHAEYDHRPNQDHNNQPAPLSGSKKAFIVNGAAYEKIGMLGRGGTSRVYSVLCAAKRTIYALKRVSLERADAETIQSYTNEIELLRRLRGHDRVIQLLDHQIVFGQNNRPKTLQMVLECGESDFANLLEEQRGKPVNMNFVGLYWEQMLEAVQAVHQENVVHTDLKPANFVLVKGRLKIIDFGIAKAVANDTVNIQRDQQIGTANYMSPEAIQRMNNQKVLKLSYPSDVWSLGCILYQMIYGNPPFNHIGVGPLPKMSAIANPDHVIDYPGIAKPQSTISNSTSVAPVAGVRVSPSAIDTMRGCLAYKKEERLTIPELLRHPFLRPHSHCLPPNATSITSAQMRVLVDWVLVERGLSKLPEGDCTAEDLFDQLKSQNSLPETASA